MTDKSTNKDDTFLKEPSIVEDKIGNLAIRMHLKEAENLPATTTAMANVAKAENRDDMLKRTGTNDYTLSLEKLLHAFDTFKREFKVGKKRIPGWSGNYNLSDPCELTILLLWQIRHVLTHRGGVIDDECKKNYEKFRRTALKDGIGPIIKLPEQLDIDRKFVIGYKNYLRVKKCIFTYIGKRVPKKDLEILRKRSVISNIKLDKGLATVSSDFGKLVFDVQEAHKCGYEIDPETLEVPEGKYDSGTGRITVSSTGKSFPVKLVK